MAASVPIAPYPDPSNLFGTKVLVNEKTTQSPVKQHKTGLPSKYTLYWCHFNCKFSF